MKKFITFLTVFALISGPVFAASSWNREGISRCEKMKEKFVYGLTNVALGWTEILQEPGEAIKEKRCFLCGFGQGLGNALGDTVGGAVHLITFWCPKTDVALPEGGTDIIGPSSAIK